METGNYDDLSLHEKALPHRESAFRLTNSEGKGSLIASALYNLGNCYMKRDIEKAESYSRESVEKYLTGGYDHTKHMAKSFLLVTHTC
ncbi:hypothetical protein AM592_05945 [Bacillus gobiensis]|uniref:Uncharacterized protein n=1 Tax=Bacillus gobiensis TaxID=1441095 RepID=A0A0M3R9C6_9BACI|nr:hypothetical protein AM592_05945 [Bacillus gobiensis]